MSAPQVNGEVPHSAFIDHLLKYPVVNDSVEALKQNQYGQKGLALGDSAYQTFAKPVIPYLAKPYQYVSPYVKRADDIGDKTLARVDETFPVVTKPSAELYADVQNLVTLPYRMGLEGKDHVFTTYNQEFKSINSDGNSGPLVAYGKALFSTALIVTAESLSWARTFLNAKKEEAKAAANN
ncbi:hypothetical protein RB594_003931 [Gaeumannomyces avenae]